MEWCWGQGLCVGFWSSGWVDGVVLGLWLGFSRRFVDAEKIRDIFFVVGRGIGMKSCVYSNKFLEFKI